MTATNPHDAALAKLWGSIAMVGFLTIIASYGNELVFQGYGYRTPASAELLNMVTGVAAFVGGVIMLYVGRAVNRSAGQPA